MLPQRIKHKSGRENAGKRCPAHAAWVRGFACSNPKCATGETIEFAHVRSGTGGGVGMKPSDRHGISLCRACHTRQHIIGEAAFEAEAGIDMRALADEFARKSPHWPKLREMV